MFWLLQRTRVSRTASLLSIVVAAALAFFGVSATDGGAASAGSASPLGVYVGYQAPGAVSAFGRALGQSPTFAMDFLDGDSWSDLVNTAPSYMAAWKGSGYAMVWGLPMLPDDSASDGYSLSQGASGAYNSYFLTLGPGHGGGRTGQLHHPSGLGIQRWVVPVGRQRAGGRLRRVLAADRRHHAVRARVRTSRSSGTPRRVIRASGISPTTTPGMPTSTPSASISTTRHSGPTRASRRNGTRTSPSRTASTGWRRSPPRRESRSRCPSGVWVRGQATAATRCLTPATK